MALQDICELNSILNVEDEEKIQLTKLKEKITSTINQQERRFYHELDERERYAAETVAIKENLKNVQAEFELNSLAVMHIDECYSKEYESRSIINLVSEYYACKESIDLDCVVVSDGCDVMDKLLVQYQALGASRIAEHLRESNEELLRTTSAVEAAMVQKADKHDMLRVRTNALEQLDIERCSTMLMHDQNSSDIQTIASEILQIEQTITILKRDLEVATSEKSTYGAANSKVIKTMKQECVSLQTMIESELQTSTDLCGEIKFLETSMDELASSRRELDTEVARITRDVDATEGAVEHAKKALCELKLVLSSIQSEIESVTSQENTVSVQSFKGKADALGSELDAIKAIIESLQAQALSMAEQLEGREQHSELEGLERSLQDLKGREARLNSDCIDCQSAEVQLQEMKAVVAIELSSAVEQLASLENDKLSKKAQCQALQALNEKSTGKLLQGDCTDVLRRQVDEVLLQSEQGEQRVAFLSSQLVEKEELLREAGVKHADLQCTAQLEMIRCVSELMLAEKKTRLAASRDTAIAVHKQALLKLRRHLGEQDKKFQQAQLDLQAKHIELKASLQKELDTVQQSLVSKHEFLVKAKLLRTAHELQQARSQQAAAVAAAAVPTRQSTFIDGRTALTVTDHHRAVFAVPEARKRKHPAVSFKPDAMASFGVPRPAAAATTTAAPCNVTSNASVASDNTSIFWSDIAPVQANSTCLPSRPVVPNNARTAASRPAAQLKAVDLGTGRSKPKMRGFGK